MEYVIFDLEWNQAQFCKRQIRNRLEKLPFRLTGEIIQIGAVRLDESKRIVGDFKIGVKPQFFSVIHQRVLEITGIDQTVLDLGVDFPAAIGHFKNWCKEDSIFMSWGEEDLDILRQNLYLYELAYQPFETFVDLQKIFGLQVYEDKKRQISLKQAAEYFSIDQSRAAHDALNDAYYAAYIAQRLDLKKGFTACKQEVGEALFANQECLKMEVFSKLKTKAEAFRIKKITRSRCPDCSAGLQGSRFIKCGKNEYLALQHCAKHGDFLVKITFERDYCFQMTARKRFFLADEQRQSFYEEKLQLKLKREKLQTEYRDKSKVKAD